MQLEQIKSGSAEANDSKEFARSIQAGLWESCFQVCMKGKSVAV